MKRIIMSIIRFYQRYISPATPPNCRYHPTCSSYALEAVDKHGALKGGVMSTSRILRCNPFVEGGVDRVPDYFTLRRNPANIGELYIPDYLLSVDAETKKEIQKMHKQFEEDLKVFVTLPDSMNILEEKVDLEELSRKDLQNEFSEDEFAYLEDIRIFPEGRMEEYRYFTLPDSEKNKKYLQKIESFDEGIVLGEDFPLIILEDTGIWYMNIPKLMNEFLINRGVTEADLENQSYHLWMVLKAIEIEYKNQ